MLVNRSPDHKPHESRASLRTDARLDSAARQKMDDLAIRFHQSRAAVLCHIMQWSLSRKETPPLHRAESYGPVCHLHLHPCIHTSPHPPTRPYWPPAGSWHRQAMLLVSMTCKLYKGRVLLIFLVIFTLPPQMLPRARSLH